MAAPKVPLKEMLTAIDRNDKSFYSRLDDDQKKAFSPWLAMRYASSSKGYAEAYLLMVNDLVNRDFGDLYKHPELQWKLLAICGVGSNQFHPWIKPGKKKTKSKIQEILAKCYPHAKMDELEMLESMTTKPELKEYLRSAGYTDKEIKETVK